MNSIILIAQVLPLVLP